MAQDDGWGGAWTEDKLHVLRGYLEAYLTALKNQPFRLYYVDAFAGAGYRKRRSGDPAQLALTDDVVEDFRDGSARIALDLDPGFDVYVFMEQGEAQVAALEALAAEHANSRDVEVYAGEANARLRDLCRGTWRNRRAVVFLDPYGMQVEWETLVALAGTEAVDVWILVPYVVAINRLLMKDLDAIPPSWKRRLDLFFGTNEWRERLYETSEQRAARTGSYSLFDNTAEGSPTKAAKLDDIAEYFLERLGTIFPHVAPTYRRLCHPNGHPLYALFFATANPNPRAGRVALNIADHLLKR